MCTLIPLHWGNNVAYSLVSVIWSTGCKMCAASLSLMKAIRLRSSMKDHMLWKQVCVIKQTKNTLRIFKLYHWLQLLIGSQLQWSFMILNTPEDILAINSDIGWVHILGLRFWFWWNTRQSDRLLCRHRGLHNPMHMHTRMHYSSHTYTPISTHICIIKYTKNILKFNITAFSYRSLS